MSSIFGVFLFRWLMEELNFKSLKFRTLIFFFLQSLKLLDLPISNKYFWTIWREWGKKRRKTCLLQSENISSQYLYCLEFFFFLQGLLRIFFWGNYLWKIEGKKESMGIWKFSVHYLQKSFSSFQIDFHSFAQNDFFEWN